jgi:hypothetical protein
VKAEVRPVLESAPTAAKPWIERPAGRPQAAPATIHESAVPDVAGPPPAPTPAAATATAARPGAQAPARLYGTGEILSRHVPRVKLGVETVLEAPAVTPSIYVFRDTAKRSPELVRQLGGSDATEQAVAGALNWFVRHQEPDGRWSCKKHGGEEGHDAAATGAAMLCFFGWGAKHNADGPYRKPIAQAVAWVLPRVAGNGNLTGLDQTNMYDQGIGTMALAEAYGVTKDPALREPLQRAVDLIVRAQHRAHGGWRYTPGAAQGDTSVGGWQVMALVSARMAGVNVPDESLRLARKWFDLVGSGPAAGHYSYLNDDRRATPCMTSVGMFCQQLFQVPPHDPRQESAASFLAAAMPDPTRRDYYYWYYGTIALYQHQGPVWEAWNEKMKHLLITSQVKGGEHAGSWEPDCRWTRGRGGRVLSTAFSTLSLEVYYRYLPLYNTSLGAAPKLKSDAAAAPEKSGKQ